MINVVIMRHGEAQPLAATDSQRTLTEHGRHEVQQMALWFSEAYPAFDYVWVSPYVRARETAALMLERLPQGAKLEVLPELVPEASAVKLQQRLDLLLAAEPDARVLMVSHMPLVSFLVEAFTMPGQAPIFSTASLCCIGYTTARGGKLLERNSPLELSLLQPV
ncbi:phosphohistidine phosphatase [Alishewanella longhuensis]|uniref:Phosphohistidine phosphatase n=1 Tax=Alishewanella longhuensis TaxID=1091037 RepID=A0ABQ3KXI4_9ALTE|nr:phosphohistidine phosphatase SixA [Alishewanella longhuensis]GHG68275.1 phosphohistidine phosphatase [Alishewanella longhuensis]